MGAVDTTYTFTATDTITSAKMNNIIDQTTITTDAIIGTTLDVASGKLKIRSQGITSNEMGTNSVTTNAITDLNVTTGKLSDLVVTTGKLADLGVTTGKIADDAITTVKVLDSNITPAKLSQPLTLATAQASTSGTSIDFTSIPAWVKRITVMFSAVSTSGSSNLLIQIGDSGGIENTGYTSVAGDFNGNTAENTIGFILDRVHTASAIFKGSIVLSLVTGNSFVSNGILAYSDSTYGATTSCSAGSKTLSAQLDRVRVTTVNGTDTFDAGSINIMYE
jgi:hypothetical protein